jgi:hypothetical protein
MTAAKRARGKTKSAKTKGAAAAAAGVPDAVAGSGAAAAADLIKQICSTSTRGAQDYGAAVTACTCASAISAVDFARQLSSVTSPLEFMKLSNAYSRQQFAALTTQTKALAGIARKLTQEAAEPAKAKVDKDLDPAV